MAANKHAAWDGGVIADMFAGILPPQKTSKTRCGIRRPMAEIDNRQPTCPACLADIARQEKLGQQLRQLAAGVEDLAQQGALTDASLKQLQQRIFGEAK
jgi:hypothetical protein